MAITIQDLFTRSMVITMPVEASNDHPETRVSYIDNENNTWNETFDIVGDLYIGDIEPQTRSATRNTPTSRAINTFNGPWITSIKCGTTVTRIAGINNDYSSVDSQVLNRLCEISGPNVTSVADNMFYNYDLLTTVNLPNL